MDAEALATGGARLLIDRGGIWRTIWTRDGIAGPADPQPNLIARSDRMPDERRSRRRWSRDFEEVE